MRRTKNQKLALELLSPTGEVKTALEVLHEDTRFVIWLSNIVRAEDLERRKKLAEYDVFRPRPHDLRLAKEILHKKFPSIY